jgi:PST family polysaccharide transporter
MLAIMSFPLLIGLFVLADEFVLTLYGEKWLGCVLPMRILIVFALRRAVGAPVTSIYDVMGRPDIGMKLAVLFIPFYLGSIWVGSLWGIVGVAAAVSIVRTLHGFLQFEVAARLLRESLIDLLKPLVPALTSSLAMGAIVYAAKVGLSSVAHIPAAASLAILVGVGAVTYLVLLRTAYRELALDVLALIPSPKHPMRIRLSHLFGNPERQSV